VRYEEYVAMQNQSNDDARFLSVREISERYEKPLATVRLLLKKKLAERSANAPDLPASFLRKGEGGRRGDGFRGDFVREAMGEEASAGRFSETEKRIFGKGAKGVAIKISGDKITDVPLTGILASRRSAYLEYNQLIAEMTKEGENLRIRCITGTDFFNSQFVWYGSLTSRIAAHLGPPKVLLVYPFERAAKLRSSAEGENLSVSQFRRDAFATYSFVKDDKELRSSVKWADDIPPSMLIWTERSALVEPYDYGGRGNDRPGCIGRKAPILVVPGGTDYHVALRDSFDYVYEDKCGPHIKTYTLQQVADAFDTDLTKKARKPERRTGQ
jgi:hypothetical protein